MIEVQVEKQDSGYRIIVDGHAGGKRGTDIVCAAVSTLCDMLIESLKSLTEDHCKYLLESGYFEIRYDYMSCRGRVLIDAFYLGLCRLMNAYPEQVELANKDRRIELMNVSNTR